MTKLRKTLLALILAVCSVFAFACKKDNKNAVTLSSIEQNGLEVFYYENQVVDFSGVSLNVKMSDNTRYTLTKGEVDVAIKDAKADTEFIIYTNNMLDLSGRAKSGEYQIQCVVLGITNEKQNLIKSYVSDTQSTYFNLTYFELPEFYATYLQNSKSVDTTGLTEDQKENLFAVSNDVYMVGSDNEFIYKPYYIATYKNGRPAALSLNTTVKICETGSTTDVGSTYYTYDANNYAIKFKDAAVGKTFDIVATPANFTVSTTNLKATVKVNKGFNVTKARDLGRISLYDTTDTELTSNRTASLQSNWDFYGTVADEIINRNQANFQNAIWTKYYKSLGLSDDEIKPVDGIYIHNDLQVLSSDVPSEYFIDSRESSFAAGSLRDRSFVFSKLVKGEFNLNGNYFKLDFSNFPIGLSNEDYNGKYYTGTDAQLIEGHSRAFQFLGDSTKIGSNKVVVKNINIIGNTGLVNGQVKSNTSAGNLNPLYSCGGIIGICSSCVPTEINNTIVKNMYFAYFADQGTGTMAIDNSKVYDCFNAAFYSWNSDENTISNSEFKRFGGPAIFLDSDANSNGSCGAIAGVDVDKNTVIENYIAGNESWFSLYNATLLIKALQNADEIGGFDIFKYSVLRNDNNADALNLIALTFTAQNSTRPEVYSVLDYEGANLPFLTYLLFEEYDKFVALYGNGTFTAGEGATETMQKVGVLSVLGPKYQKFQEYYTLATKYQTTGSLTTEENSRFNELQSDEDVQAILALSEDERNAQIATVTALNNDTDVQFILTHAEKYQKANTFNGLYEKYQTNPASMTPEELQTFQTLSQDADVKEVIYVVTVKTLYGQAVSQTFTFLTSNGGIYYASAADESGNVTAMTTLAGDTYDTSDDARNLIYVTIPNQQGGCYGVVAEYGPITK